MAFGRNKQPQSYGVPVRAAAPPAIPVEAPQTVGAPSFMPAPAQQFATPYAPQQYAAPYTPQQAQQYAAPYAPQQPQPYAQPYAQQWTPNPSGFAPLPPNPAYTGAPGKTTRKPFKIAAAVIVATVVIGGAVSSFKEQSALKAPQTLAGRAIATDPALIASAKKVTSQLRNDNQGHGATAAFYVDDSGHVTVGLVALRGRTSEERDVSDMVSGGVAIDRASNRYFGDFSCYTAGVKSLCLWHAGISGIVITFGTASLEETAAIAAEARAALH